MGNDTIPPITSGGNTFWIDKKSNLVISATPKSGYLITGGTGNVGELSSEKTVNVTSKSSATIQISEALSISKLEIAVNGSSWTTMSTGTTYNVTPGVTKIRATSSYGSVTRWFIISSPIGTGTTATLAVPSSATGLAVFGIGNNNGYGRRHNWYRSSGSWWLTE